MTEIDSTPTRDQILEIIRRGVVEILGDAAPEVTEQSAIGEDGIGIDSLDLIEVVMQVEEELGIAFDSDEFSGIVSIEELLTLIETKVAQRGHEAS